MLNDLYFKYSRDRVYFADASTYSTRPDGPIRRVWTGNDGQRRHRTHASGRVGTIEPTRWSPQPAQTVLIAVASPFV